MDDNTKQHIRNLTVAAAAGIPVAGGTISVLLDKYIPEFIQERKNSLLLDINSQLERVAAFGNPLDLEEKRFQALFIKCFRLALEESQDEKIEAFKNIIVNAASNQHLKFNEVDYYIRLVQDLTSDQILILKGFREHKSIFRNTHADLYYVMKENFPNLDIDYMQAITQELLSLNLIRSAQDNRNKEHPDFKSGYTHFTSKLADRFLDWILLEN